MADEVVIGNRFRGPRDSGNGGYSCGLLARRLGPAPAEVTLRLPPPLERPLAVERTDGGAEMRDGDVLVAEAEELESLEIEAPAPIGLAEASEARRGSPIRHAHPITECFVCGPARERGDGLGIVCGPVGDGVVAAPWDVDDSLPRRGEEVAAEVVWAALDCPGGIAGILQPGLGVTVLGRLAARVLQPIRPGTTCVAVGWPIDRDGRKFRAGSALFSPGGEPLALGRATWIELRT
jgi:hypothetical protein